MHFLPKDDVSRLQLALLLFLSATLFSTFLGAAAFIASFLLLGAFNLLLIGKIRPQEKKTARVLLAAFSAFSMLAFLARRLAGDSALSLLVFPALTLAFLAAYLALRLFAIPWKVECRVLGYSNGLAIVETGPSLSSTLQPGRHVIESRPVKAGRTGFLVLRKSVFGPGKPERLVITKESP